MLYKNSYRLEHSNSDGKGFLPILRSELKKFKKLQHLVINTITFNYKLYSLLYLLSRLLKTLLHLFLNHSNPYNLLL